MRRWLEWQEGWRHRQRNRDRIDSRVWARHRDLKPLLAAAPRPGAGEPRDDPRLAAQGYNAGPANRNPTAGEGYAARAVELIAHYHALAGAGGPGAPHAAVVQDGYALPFDPAGLHAVTTEARLPRDPEWQLVKPHHSGRVAVDVSLRVGTPLYALVDGDVAWVGDSGNCGYGVTIRNADQHASVTYCHLSAIDVTARQQVVAGQPIGRSGGQPGTRGAGNSTARTSTCTSTPPQGAAAHKLCCSGCGAAGPSRRSPDCAPQAAPTPVRLLPRSRPSRSRPTCRPREPAAGSASHLQEGVGNSLWTAPSSGGSSDE